MTTQLYTKDIDGTYEKIHIYNIKTIWRNINSIPKTGEEVLVCNIKQGNVKNLVYWNKIHNVWKSKGEIIVSLQADYWCKITEPIKAM